MMMDKYKFGEFIYTQRKKLGLTQDELGRKLKVTNKAVSKWETGETLPDIQLLPELASTLNVTIDELLTQVKPEPEKVMVDPKKKTRIFLWVFSMVFMTVTIVLSLIIVGMIVIKDDEIIINSENYNEYFEITPCEKFVTDGYGIDIYGTIDANDKVINPSLTLNFTVQYYYINTDNELSEILYVERYISYDELTNDFTLILRPKSQIDNFKSFYAVNVSYEVVEADGRYLG